MRVLNFGSINIDTVFEVAQLVRPGETIAARAVRQFAGGKGANQSVALARAGASVFHAGRIGPDGAWVIDQLRSAGVDSSLIVTDPAQRTGSAFIQVADDGQNAIVLDAAANHHITAEQIDTAIERFAPGDVLLLQNEVNDIPAMIAAGRRNGLTIAFNPAPMTAAVRDYPLEQIDLLIANELEAEALTGVSDPAMALRRLPGRERMITLGERGAMLLADEKLISVPSPRVQVVDTTAAGDTFIGYFLASRLGGHSLEQSLKTGCHAAALCVSRAGAMQSIPTLDELTPLTA